MSFPTPIESLTLHVTTGVSPNSQTFEQTITPSELSSTTNNSVQITNNNGLLTAFNTQPPGTIFNASIVITYNEGTFTTGDTISTPSLLNFVPNPLVLSNFGPFSYNYVSGGFGTFTLLQPSSNSNSPGAFTYSVVGNTGVVSVSANVATMLSAGSTTIRATQAASGGYTSAYVDASVTVNPIAPTFSNGGVFTIPSKNFGDAPFTPAYPTSNSSGAFTYTSSTPSVATVNSSSGVVTIASIGSTTIRATQAAAGGYTSAYVEASVTINPIAPTFGSFSIDSRDFGATPFTLTAPESDSDGAFTYQSSDESVATVTVARFTTTSLLARYDASQSSNYTLSGSNVTQCNDLTGNGYHLTQNGTGPSLTTINSVTAFDFNSSRGLINASVPLNSVVTVFMVIRYSTNNGTWGSFMHHGDRDNDWAIERNSFSGTPHNIQFQSNNENGGNELIATNGVNYILVCRISGNTREFWRYSDTQALGSATSTGVTIVTGNKILYVGKSDVNEACNSTIGEILYYNATLSNADVNANVLYLQNKWFNNLNTPYVTIVGAGTTIITATQEAAGSYTSGSITAPFVVNPIAPTLSNFSISSRNFGDAPFTLTPPTSDSPGAFTYTSNTPSVATISGNIATVVGVGTSTITATQSATGNYLSGTVDATLTVTS
jgi:hypothetical protein